MKKLKSLGVFLLCTFVPYILVKYTIKFQGLEMGLGVLLLILIALFLYLKPKIYTLIARRMYMVDHQKGFKWFQKAYDTGKMNPQQALIYAYLLIRNAEIDKAERLITSVLLNRKSELTQTNILASDLNMAIILWKKGDLKGAIKKMEYVYQTGYRSSVHYATLGVFYILNGDYEKALEFTLEGRDYSPCDQSINDNLGLCYYHLGENEKAKKVYEEIFDLKEPDFIECYYNYGLCLEKDGEYEKAYEYFKKARSCAEKYLSTVKIAQVDLALDRVEKLI